LGAPIFWSWVILFAVFIVDATVTLAWRIVRRERFYEAHRSHAYQHAARRWGHKPVTIGASAITVVWLLPIALAVAHGSMAVTPGVLIAYSPLIALAQLIGAGRNDARA
jgi:Fuc2NAc and GlcNAc transferase